MFISNENRKVLKIENDARTQHITIEENDAGEIKVTGVGPDFGADVGYVWKTVFDDEVITEKSEEEDYAVGYLGKDFDDPFNSWLESIIYYAKNGALTITVNGKTYEVKENAEHYFGAMYDEDTDSYDWSEYPFSLNYGDNFVTKDAGAYTIKICAKMLQKIPDYMIDVPKVNFDRDSSGTFYCNMTFKEVSDLYMKHHIDHVHTFVNYGTFTDSPCELIIRSGTNIKFSFNDYTSNYGSDWKYAGKKLIVFKSDESVTISDLPQA